MQTGFCGSGLEGKRPVGMPRRRWMYNTNMYRQKEE